ncbi:MAG: hypothetical protein VXZ96_08745 [Myxococcota bacterium]|nr:hypothetical protein [Myxococcota bacterium]
MSSFSIGQLIANRYKLQGHLPSTDDILRFAVEDIHTGQNLELHTPSRTALLRPNALSHFQTTHQQRSVGNGVWPIVTLLEESNRPFVVCQPTRGSLEKQVQDTDVLYQMAQWLIPAIIDNAAYLTDGLHPQDIVLSPEGEPYILPAGIVNTHKLGQLNLYKAEGTPEQAALYGLGVLLFELASGTVPFKTNSPTDLKRLQQAPPRLSQHLSNPSTKLEELIAQLMDPNPKNRMLGLPETITSPPKLRVGPKTKRLKPKRAPTSSQRSIPPRLPVIIFAPEGLPDSLKRTAAAYGDLNPAKLQTHEGAFPITSAKDEARALEICKQLQELGIQAQVETSKSKSQLGSTFVYGTLALIGATALFGVAIGMAAALLTGILFKTATSPKSKPSPLWHTLRQQDPNETTVDIALFEARRTIVHSEIPQLAKMDLIDSLERLIDIWQSSDSSSLSATDEQAIIGAAQELEDAALAFTSRDNIKASVKQVQNESLYIRQALSQNLE